MLLACLRGTVFMYQGEELGLPQSEVAFEDLQDPFGKAHWPLEKGRDGCRTPMPWRAKAHAAGFSTGKPWLPADAAHAALAVDVQEADEASTLQLTRRVLALRRAHPALRLGRFDTLSADATALVLRRVHAGDVMLAAFNFGDAVAVHELEATPTPGGPALALHGASLSGARLRLPPGAALVVSLHA